MFQEVDPILGPEMRSTGEVLGLSPSYGEAFFKAQEATQSKLPFGGTALISVNRKDKEDIKVNKKFLWMFIIVLLCIWYPLDKNAQFEKKKEKNIDISIF